MIGQTISHYKILEKLGEGGMGIVYKAHDTKLKRDVALKFLSMDLIYDKDAKARFIHEAQVASSLQHTNICTIHDIEETKDGQLFIVMDYYDGESLKDRLNQGPIPMEEAATIAIQLAQGLQKAHKKEIVHRDVKPGNIIITTDGIVKIVDFGLAKLKGSRKLTKTGTTLGTVAYMAPEQIQGDTADQQSDIFSFGVVLYEMLTGNLPYRGEHEAAMIYSIMNEDPKPLDQLSGELAKQFTHIITRCLHKDRTARYSSMSVVLHDLKELPSSIIRQVPGATGAITDLFKRPIVISSLALLLIIAVFFIYKFIDHNKQVTWARQVALPEIDRLIGEAKSRDAFTIARKVESIIPEDSTFLRLFGRISSVVSVRSAPPGAKVYRNNYDGTDNDWEYLGTTPTDSVRFPSGLSRLRIEKDGYRTFLGAVFPARVRRSGFTLDSVGKYPDEMVYVRGGGLSLNIPGLDNLDSVQMSEYLIDRYEVTNKEYQIFVSSGGYQKKEYWTYPFIKNGQAISWEEAMSEMTDATGKPGPASWELGMYLKGKENYPVNGVSWYEAAAYAEFVGKKLPTLYHWNRATEPTIYRYVVPLSNFKGEGPAIVGSYKGLGPFGTYDLAGNVREWCINEAKGKRYSMGGGWDDQEYLAIDAFAQDPFDRSPTNGFRCIKILGQENNWPTLARVIEFPFRDFMKEKPVPDDVFKLFLAMFRYDRTDLHAIIESADTTEDWIKQKITYDAAYGPEKMMAYLFLPRGFKPPYQCAVWFPGSEGIHTRSSKKLPSMPFFEYIIKSGRAVIYPIYKGMYERGDGLNSDYQDESNFYRDHVIMWAKDLSRTIDYLETRSDIDASRLAYYGGSMGAALGGIMPAVETRFKAIVLSVAGLMFQKTQPQVDPINYLPRIKIPVLMLNGQYDYFFPVETSQIPMFKLFGTPSEHKRHIIFETSHAVPRNPLIKETLGWLDKYLGQVQK